MHLHPPVRAYFDARGPAFEGPLVEAFAPDAVVADDGQTLIGHAAIAAWWRAAKERYGHTAQPFEARDEHGLTIVRATVTGRFPGSPVDLTFAFRLAGGRIAALEITP